MCYGMRLDVLNIIDFPEFQFNEGIFVSSRLNGRFYKDGMIQIIFKTPSSLKNEIKRRTRQEISTQKKKVLFQYAKEGN
jgi:hypothetical protein